MSKFWVAGFVAAVFFAVAFLILYQQAVTFGIWFQVDDLHHETFALAAVALGIGVLIGASIVVPDQPALAAETCWAGSCFFWAWILRTFLWQSHRFQLR